MVDGVQAFAKCSECGDVLWTDVSSVPQAVACRCGHTTVVEDVVTGPVDQSFAPQSLQGLLDAEANS